MTDKQYFDSAVNDAIGSEMAKVSKDIDELLAENEALKKELERYHSLFKITGEGLTPEQEEFWSDVSKLKTRGQTRFGKVHKVGIRNPALLYPVLVFFDSGSETFLRIYNIDGTYFVGMESEYDIIKDEVPNG